LKTEKILLLLIILLKYEKIKGTGIVHTAPAFGADDYKVAV